jgi:ankyrin repeat protein
MLAAAAGSSDVAMFLLDHNANVNAKSTVHGCTPLMIAAASGRVSTVFNLIEMGALVNAKDKVGLLGDARFVRPCTCAVPSFCE